MASLSWSAFDFGSIDIEIDRLGELHRLEDDGGVFLGAERIAGARVLEADRGTDVAGEHLADFLTLVRVHLQQTGDAFLLVLVDVVHVRARFELAGIHAEERQPADERVGHDLEGESRERLVVRGLAGDQLLIIARLVTGDGSDLERRREVIDHRVEQRLHALVLE